MNYFNMSYKEVLKMPFQQLLLLSKSIPKYEKTKSVEKKEETKNIFDLVGANNLIKNKICH